MNLVTFALLTSALTSAPTMTRDEFKMFQHYKNALADPRVQKMKEEQRLPAIAKDAGFALKDLKRAVEKGEAEGDLKAACVESIKQAIAASTLGYQIDSIDVDTEQPHAVAYVSWINQTKERVIYEAVVAAKLVQGSCPLLSSIQLWAVETPKATTRVFEGLIPAASANNIDVAKAKDFAQTRYIRLFEKVKGAPTESAP